MAKFNPRLLIPVAGIAAIALGGWYVDARRNRERSMLSGFFESQPTQIASRITGRVTRITVSEGQNVAQGTPLIEMEATAQQADAAAKQATAAQVNAQMHETVNGPRQEEIRKQEALVAERTADLTRLQNGPLPEEIRAAQARLERAEATDKKVHSGARPEEVAQAKASEAAARAHLAQALRGPTVDEKTQAKARLDAAVAREILARDDAERFDKLYRQEAVTRQQWDQAQSNRRETEAQRQEAEAAWQRAQTGTPAAELEQARQEFEQAKAASDLVRAGSRPEDVRAADAEVTEARENLALLQRGTRPEEITAARAQQAQALATLAELRAGNRREQIAQAHAAAEAAHQSAKSAMANAAERIVRAPQAGVVERIPVTVGDLVSAGSTVVRLSDPQDIWLRIYVPEADLARVSVGDIAQLRVDGVASPINARIESIATQGEFTPANLQTPNERGKQVFGVRLRLEKPDSKVKAGMYATVTRIGNWEL